MRLFLDLYFLVGSWRGLTHGANLSFASSGHCGESVATPPKSGILQLPDSLTMLKRGLVQVDV
jgi:hypothetical protein